MKTTYRIRQPLCEQFMACLDEVNCVGDIRPARFKEKMWKNQGSVGSINGWGTDEDGLELKNPVIVGLGDSVTAGHFESLLPTDPEKLKEMFAGMMSMGTEIPADRPVDYSEKRAVLEITDARESYLEKFREMLIDKYELTSVSTVNCGIAGDNLIQMNARLYRDVIRYQPDLVLINGSLNWDVRMGDAQFYENLLTEMVRRIKKETDADIILLTPNGDLPNPMAVLVGAPLTEPSTPERVEAIRRVAAAEQVCLADVRAVWDEAKKRGIDWKELLANGINHPSVEGHEVYARVLMKLFE